MKIYISRGGLLDWLPWCSSATLAIFIAERLRTIGCSVHEADCLHGGFLESHWSSVVEGWGSGVPVSTKDSDGGSGGGGSSSSRVDASTVRPAVPLCGSQGPHASHQVWQQMLYMTTHLTGPKINSLWKRDNIQMSSNLQQMRCYVHIKEFFKINVVMISYQSSFIWIFYIPMQKKNLV